MAVVEKRIEEVAVVGVRAVEESTDAGSFVRAEAAERPSPEQSTLRVTTGGTVSTRSGDSRSPNESTPPHSRGSRINGGSSKGIEEVARGRRAEHDFKGDACDEEMLKKARKQVKRRGFLEKRRGSSRGLSWEGGACESEKRRGLATTRHIVMQYWRRSVTKERN